MAQGGGGHENKGPSGEATAFVTILLLVGGCWLLWIAARPAIVFPLFGMTWLQYRLLDLLHLLNDRDGRTWMLWTWQVLTGVTPTAEVNWADVVDVQTDIGLRMRYAICAVLGGLAVLVIFRMRGEGFKRQYSLTGQAYDEVVRVLGKEVKAKPLQKLLTAKYSWWTVRSLAKLFLFVTGLKWMVKVRKEWVRRDASFADYQASHWKVTMVGANFDSNKNEAAEMPQLMPMEWLRDNKIRLTRKEGLDDEAATRAFEKQLGPSWNGVEQAPYHVQALCVMAGLNARREKKKGPALRDALSEIHATQPPAKAAELTKAAIAPYLADKSLVESINRVGGKHAFMNTAAIGVYGIGGPMKEWGGGDAGVLATSMFRWIKKVDRQLWYCLNNVGRRAFHIEGAGAVSHFQAERVLGQPLSDPYVESALEGLLTYLDDQALDDVEAFFRKKPRF